MFFGDPVAAFRKIRRALRPGGRLALMSWQQLRKNEWMMTIRDALAVGRMLPEPPTGGPGPFGLADAEAVRRILAEAGFEDIALAGLREPVCLGACAQDAFDFVLSTGMAKGLLDELDETTRPRALEALRSRLAGLVTDQGVLLHSSAWLITARCP